MTGKQKFLQLVNPIFEKTTKIFKMNTKNFSAETNAITAFSEIDIELNNGKLFDIAAAKNKKILIVNTASDCGYTAQYEDLEKLYQLKKDVLEIIAFPSNEFGEQEKGDDETIANFCKVNYGVTFNIAKKSSVLKNADQTEVYKWLTDNKKNGWNEFAPSWNFCKYLIDQKGNLTNVFEASIAPLSAEMLTAIEK